LAPALEDTAEALARTGNEPEARPLAAEALQIYAGLGAAADIARARARLRSARLRAGVRGPRGRPRHGWDSLTEAELRVVRRVAEGRSNLEIAAVYLTRRTVRAHVSSALAKLDLSSRVELALEAARHPLAP
jgi:DNA-binding CsgD family transcriptional regulator